jgi:hypothetical protein
MPTTSNQLANNLQNIGLQNLPQSGLNLPNLQGLTFGAMAVGFAKGVIGDPYAWGQAGPASFDCSGLVVWAYAQAGKSGLPHNVGAMVSDTNDFDMVVDGTKNPGDWTSQLQPGDLICWMTPAQGDNSKQHVQMAENSSTYVAAQGTQVQEQPINTNWGGTGLPFRAVLRVKGDGGGTPSGGSSTSGNISDNPDLASQGTIGQDLPDPRNNLPFSALFQGSTGFTYMPPPGSSLPRNVNYALVRGGMSQLLSQSGTSSQLQAQVGGQFAAYFMMNPSSISVDCTVNPSLPSPQTMSSQTMQEAPPWLAQQTVSFSLIFNRMYEVWEGPVQNPGPNNGPGPAD